MKPLTAETIYELYEQHYLGGVCDFYTFAEEVIKVAQGVSA